MPEAGWRDEWTEATWRDEWSETTWRDEPAETTWRDEPAETTWRDESSAFRMSLIDEMARRQADQQADALEWTYTILGAFAEAVQVGELSTGLDILAGLSACQQAYVINVSPMMLDRGMSNEIPGAPDRLSYFGGNTIPPASKLDVPGYVTPARGVLVATWTDEVGKFVIARAQRHGLKHTAGVVVLSVACMLLTWQLETGESLQDVLDCFPSVWGATGAIPFNTTPLCASDEERSREDIPMALL